MKPSSATLIIVVSLFIATTVFGTGPAVQHQFRGGDPASATQVNENFQELADRIQELNNQTRTYDYHTYITPSNISSKTFSVTPAGDASSNLNCQSTLETRQYERVPQGSDLLITVTHKQTDTNINQVCNYYSFNFLATAERLLLLNTTHYDTTTPDVRSIVSENNYNDDLPILTVTMKEGVSWGSVSSTTVTDNSLIPPVVNEPGRNHIWHYTLVGIEDVTVPYDNGRNDNIPTTYSNCLKVIRDRHGTYLAHVEWYCPDIGFVKRMSDTVTILLTGVS
jgi:hypothetical protein